MSSTIQLLQHLDLHGATIRFMRNNGTFPLNPTIGQLAFVDGVLYLYSQIGVGLASWYPLTTKQETYVHVQGLASTTWTVNHGLSSKNVIFFVYNNDGELITAQISNIADNSFDINFTEATDGRCVVFSDGIATAVAGAIATAVAGASIGLPIEISDVNGLATAISDRALLAGSTSQSFSVNNLTSAGNLMPTVNGGGQIGSNTMRWGSIWCNDMHVSANTLYIGDTPFMSGTDGTAINLTAITDQNISVITSGTGTTNVTSQTSVTIDAPVINITGAITLSEVGLANSHDKSGSVSGVGTLTVDSVSSTVYRSMEVVAQITQGANFELVKLLIVHNGTSAFVTEYGRTTAGTATDVAFDATVSGGNLVVSAVTAITSTIKFKRTAIKI